MRSALTPLCAAAALVLCAAGLAKLRSPGPAARALATIGMPVGGRLVRGFAACELALGASCLLAPRAANAAALACVYAIFAGLTLLLARHRAACGCFGDHGAPASAIQSLLSAVLALIALAATIAPPHGLGWIVGQHIWLVAVLTAGVAGAAFGTVVAYTELPRAWGSWSGG
jgi:hypothetical protein